MKREAYKIILATLLIILNAIFILWTIKKQDTFELAYNNVVVILNILYCGIDLIPNKED